jgi:alpha-N-arabinofuranosidase
MNRKTGILVMICFASISVFAQKQTAPKIAKQTTAISVTIPDKPISIDPMIYGQMLEDCNDKVIYGGVVNADGTENPKVIELLKPLNMTVMRWPGGTYVMEYDWKKGVGHMSKRPLIQGRQWKQVETNQFGTDEFLQWCKKVGTVPYINLNMGTNPDVAGALGDALNWIEYVNGSTNTILGKLRAKNGHEAPYNVEYWGIGNENYFSEDISSYSNRLYRWASAIHSLYPDTKLIGVGHTYQWNDEVLQQNGKLIDLLTLHFYITAKVKDNTLENEAFTTFAPAKVEVNIRRNTELLDKVNTALGRTDNPLRFSIDEWNCRHSVFDGEKYNFTRHDDRRQFDVAVVAGMLNVFIRQSPYVGMANYIFPVNGHGLIRTVGETDAYRTPPYYVFELYRKYMTGQKLDVTTDGPSAALSVNNIAVEGDINKEVNEGYLTLTFVDATAVRTDENTIYVALVNRSHNESQKIKLKLPEGYIPVKMWKVESDNINHANTQDKREVIIPSEKELSKKDVDRFVIISPCGVNLVKCESKTLRKYI